MHQIVFSDPARLVEIIDFAEQNKCSDALGKSMLSLLRTLAMGMTRQAADGRGLDLTAGPAIRSEVWRDFAPLSLGWAIFREGTGCIYNGGLIYVGPGAPGDGSAPAFSVDLGWVAGQRPTHSWNIHT